MSNPDDPNPEKEAQRPTPQPPAGAGDLESQTSAPAGGGGGGGGGGVSHIMRGWSRGDLLKNGSLASRGLGLVFSLLAFLIMVCNRHGPGRNFDDYEEYRYVLAIAILSILYTGFQLFRQVHGFSTGREMFRGRNMAMIDFFGDQIIAYLLISAASSAVPMTNRIREGADNIFTDSCAASISMEFFAFFSLAVSALISGYKLSNGSYI